MLDEALKQLKEEWDSFRPPQEIYERIFYHYREGKDTDGIINAFQKEFDLRRYYAGKYWWYSTGQADFKPVVKRIGLHFNCGACSEECISERYRKGSRSFGKT